MAASGSGSGELCVSTSPCIHWWSEHVYVRSPSIDLRGMWNSPLNYPCSGLSSRSHGRWQCQLNCFCICRLDQGQERACGRDEARFLRSSASVLSSSKQRNDSPARTQLHEHEDHPNREALLPSSSRVQGRRPARYTPLQAQALSLGRLRYIQRCYRRRY